MTTSGQRLYMIDLWIGDQVLVRGKNATIIEMERPFVTVKYDDTTTEQINPARTTIKGATNA